MTKDVTRDAVMLLPGIMGSELVDTTTGKRLWGLADLGWYVSAWTTGCSMEALALTDDERAGRTGRVAATGLLKFPAFSPILRGVEPYTELLRGLRRVVPHPDAIAEFPYDWRLSIEHNAQELARRADVHLRRWRAHSEGSADAKLVLVAHSMGGLVARYFTTVLGGSSEVRATITLGTPFYGAVKAAMILNSGRGGPVPLPSRRLRTLAATLPGLHDLLPSYRCVDEGTSVRRLTPTDVDCLGGDIDLARQSFARRELLLSSGEQGLRALVGVEQPTAQSMLLRNGVVEPKYYAVETDTDGKLSRVDRMGDSTVYRDAAAPRGLDPSVLPQCHGSIAKTAEAVTFVRAKLTDKPLGPPLAGPAAFGIEVPDVVAAGEAFDVRVLNTDDPTRISCVVEEARRHTQVARLQLKRGDRTLTASVILRAPGVYRVKVKRGGNSPVSELVMAGPPDMSGEKASD
ncbi:esterase/lipase family protein [Nocardia sp. CA-119907]|uniref:esterase/lipase family protein n=1 Tax=Nocardia sp. CA-119907 TaxID=3239973 RepID=UPI003D988167